MHCQSSSRSQGVAGHSSRRSTTLVAGRSADTVLRMRSVPSTQRWPTTYSTGGLVCSVDHLASSAGAQILAAGGSAADAAIAANAVLAVTTPHMCGLGGDLFALVHTVDEPAPAALNASGRAGSGADPARMRAEGHDVMPMYGDLRSAPVPGCVDGW